MNHFDANPDEIDSDGLLDVIEDVIACLHAADALAGHADRQTAHAERCDREAWRLVALMLADLIAAGSRQDDPTRHAQDAHSATAGTDAYPSQDGPRPKAQRSSQRIADAHAIWQDPHLGEQPDPDATAHLPPIDRTWSSPWAGRLVSRHAVHIGRAWSGHAIEDDCPCGQAPCGLVDATQVDPACGQHATSRTLRQIHGAHVCPTEHLDRQSGGGR